MCMPDWSIYMLPLSSISVTFVSNAQLGAFVETVSRASKTFSKFIKSAHYAQGRYF